MAKINPHTKKIHPGKPAKHRISYGVGVNLKTFKNRAQFEEAIASSLASLQSNSATERFPRPLSDVGCQQKGTTFIYPQLTLD